MAIINDKYNIAINAFDYTKGVIDGIKKSLQGLKVSVPVDQPLKKFNSQLNKVTQQTRLIKIGFSQQQALSKIKQFQKNIQTIPLKKQVDLAVATSNKDIAQQKRLLSDNQNLMKNLIDSSSKYNQKLTQSPSIIAQSTEEYKNQFKQHLKSNQQFMKMFNDQNLRADKTS